ncbi:MAG: hypothetical protein ACRELB_07950, partial [Polyangiaceae bacterium]
MQTWHRWKARGVAAVGGLALACGGQASSGGNPGGGGGPGASACDDYFQQLVSTNCLGPLPSDQLSTYRSRFGQLCTATIALPGSTVTPGALESCVSAMQSSGCSALAAPAGPCVFDSGSLGAGAACLSDGQCQSGICATQPGADGGAILCGSCAAPATPGA